MEDQSIYQILKQNNVYYTIFKEIDTIVFDVKNSSQKLISKILKSSCQYEDTNIILDLGSNSSRNVIRRIIKTLRDYPIQSPKMVLRFKQDNTNITKNIIDYMKLVPQHNNLQKLIYFQPQNNIEIKIEFMSIKFVSEDKLLLQVNKNEIQINFKLIQSKTNKNGETQQIIIDQKTNMGLFQNLEEVILYNLPLYGLSKENSTFVIEQIIQMTVIFEADDDQLPHIFTDNFIEYFNSKKNIFIKTFVIQLKQKLEIDDLFDKLMTICDTTQKIKSLNFLMLEEEMTYVSEFNSITTQISNMSYEKGQFKPHFLIQKQIDVLKIYFKIKVNGSIDLSEFIIRFRKIIFIKQIEVEIIYQKIWENLEISIGDIFDLLSKLKNLTYYSVYILKMHSYHSQFALIYDQQKEQYLIQQIEDTLDLAPYIAFNKNAKNLKIQYIDNLVSIQKFHKSLIQLIQTSNLKRMITFQFNLLCRNQIALAQLNELIPHFQFVNLISENANSLSILQINSEEEAQKVREIKVLNSKWSPNFNLQMLITKFPNIVKLNLNNKIELKDPIYQKSIESVYKYFNAKRLLFYLSKELKFKRKEMLADILLEFLS